MASPISKKQKMEAERDVVLYSYWRSSCSWRVRMALEWKGIAYEVKPVHLLSGGGEHFQEHFTNLNPNQVHNSITHRRRRALGGQY